MSLELGWLRVCRSALAFAMVVLSTCGLFLLLAAPFLSAATIIIYAGAIIVTFLFVIMLSRQEGPSPREVMIRPAHICRCSSWEWSTGGIPATAGPP